MLDIFARLDSATPQPSAVNQRDVRDTELWRELSKHFQNLHGPAFGSVSDAADTELSPDGQTVSFTGTIWKTLEDGSPSKRICLTNATTGKTEVITYGPNNDQQAKWSPMGRNLAFLSDRMTKGTFHLYLLNPGHLGEAKPVHLPSGYTAEFAAWSPTGEHILISTAGLDADQAGGSGSGTLGSADGSQLPAWMPSVEPDAQKKLRRTIFVYDLAKGEIRPLSRCMLNIWEAAWCGPTRIIAIASEDPTESSWYESTVELIDASTGDSETIYTSAVQLALPSASPSGSHAAFVEGLFSDRGVVAGTPILFDVEARTSCCLHTGGVDASQLSWIDDQTLFFIGLRGLYAVAGRINTGRNQPDELWTTGDSLGLRYPQASQIVDECFAVARSSWTRYPELGLVRSSSYQTLASFDHDGASYLRSVCGPVEEISWPSQDGLEIQGFLCLPKSAELKKPLPLVLHVHGGPVWAFTNAWQLKYPFVPLLVAHGYAVLSANPRGSRGRGDDFANRVRGDMGGRDVQDLLSGIDTLVKKGTVDPKRLGVIGGSYGGFMSAWLITQTKRFAASIAMAPTTDWLSQHTTSNIPAFDRIMLQDDPYSPVKGQYYDRSPLRFVRNCATPLLQLVGSEDRCTPPSQALQFHNALLEHGVESTLVTYPGEGHGVRKFPAVIDYCYRILSWFHKHMPAEL
ncbi:hypothetical protein QQS21_007330 [Conoideocrella luteorostrata]|uniref:Dipeptidyl-peptidase V n=1 Tax=Conoideocrella luteorostrata TaxID=1105319 RepID=A0AAJ0FSJ7_9HYPO|nr:hypothetical protein QQS21_007330 [Conoideocrella luteorostrata]